MPHNEQKQRYKMQSFIHASHIPQTEILNKSLYHPDKLPLFLSKTHKEGKTNSAKGIYNIQTPK